MGANINKLQYTSWRIVREDNTILNEAGVSGIKTVGSWEEAIDKGQSYEISAVADGAYALAAYHEGIIKGEIKDPKDSSCSIHQVADRFKPKV